jgi:dihydroceramidase
MHLLTTPLIYRLLSFKASPQKTRIVGTVLTILFTVVMVTHMVMDEFILHATTFGLGVYIIATRVLRIIPEQVKDPVIKKNLQNVATLGLCKYIQMRYFQLKLTGCSSRFWFRVHCLADR